MADRAGKSAPFGASLRPILRQLGAPPSERNVFHTHKEKVQIARKVSYWWGSPEGMLLAALAANEIFPEDIMNAIAAEMKEARDAGLLADRTEDVNAAAAANAVWRLLAERL